MSGHRGPDDAWAQPGAVVGAKDADGSGGERQVDQCLVPDRLGLLRCGACRPDQSLQAADRPSGVGGDEIVHKGNDPARVGTDLGHVSPVHPVSAVVQACAQQGNLRERRADQDRLTPVEPRVKEFGCPGHELVRAGVPQGGMSRRLCAGLHQIAHPPTALPLTVRWLLTPGNGALPASLADHRLARPR